ncbi:uncharacterized protein METZ01_LOCUS151644, partial [marine metagenome]
NQRTFAHTAEYYLGNFSGPPSGCTDLPASPPFRRL